MERKTCKICTENFPATTEYFYKNKSSRDGLHPYCKPCSVKKSKQNQLEKHDEYKEYWRDRFNTLYENDPSIRERQKSNQRKRENKDELYREWQQNNPDKLKGYANKRITKKHEISKNEWENCKNYFNYRCAYCDLPIEEHWVKYRGETFIGDFHRDHADDEGANDLSNCIPACKSCNGTKHDSKMLDWYISSNPIYSEDRVNKIHKWLDEGYKLYMQ